MIRFLLPLLTLTSFLSLKSQINAGDVPAGMCNINPGVSLSILTNSTVDTVSFDIDGDGVNDILARLKRGVTAIDIPNNAELHILNPSLQFCRDTNSTNYFSRPQYYTFGQLLDCSGAFALSSDSILILGDMGTMTASGPFSMTNTYISYQLGAQTGWINLSFDLYEVAPTPDIALEILGILSPCPSAIETQSTTSSVSISPNPSDLGYWTISSSEIIKSYELYSVSGQLIQSGALVNGRISTPITNGIYILTARTVNEDFYRRKLIVK